MNDTWKSLTGDRSPEFAVALRIRRGMSELRDRPARKVRGAA